MTSVLHVPGTHALNRVAAPLRQKIVAAQGNLIDMEFRSAAELFTRVCDDLKVRLSPPDTLKDGAVQNFADQRFKDLVTFFTGVLERSGVPEHAVRSQAANLSHRVQLVRAFQQPDKIVSDTCEKVVDVLGKLPATAEHIRCGKNPGDVLDPYILAAAQVLVYAGDFESTVSATVTHKVFMMVEGLIGHLHEDVLGAMRGNVRTAEPRGKERELPDPETNTFPGADIVQPPLGGRRPLRIRQVKSKTGSANSSSGRRLGLQLEALRGLYDGEIFFDALIGNTLRGHRTITGVMKVAPNAVVLVGEAAFRDLTDSDNGPELLLRLYQEAFEVAAQRSGYNIQEVVAAIYATFKQKADAHGEDFLETVLREAVGGEATQQDSRKYSGRARRTGGA